jgi:hypothetical protein
MNRPKKPDQKTVTIGDKSFDAMWADFLTRNSCPSEVLRAEDGWRTTAEIAVQMGVTKTTAEYHLQNALTNGSMERRVGRSENHKRAYFWRPARTGCSS